MAANNSKRWRMPGGWISIRYCRRFSCSAFFGFFAKFWTHNGQTLGMQVWGIRIQNKDGSAIDLWQALLRFLLAILSWLCLGLGFLWMLWDKEKRTWHDIYSESQAVQLPKNIHKK